MRLPVMCLSLLLRRRVVDEDGGQIEHVVGVVHSEWVLGLIQIQQLFIVTRFQVRSRTRVLARRGGPSSRI